MGRPRKSDPRDWQLKLSLTAQEYESIIARAKAIGVRPAHFVRALALNSNSASAPIQPTRSHVERLNYSALVRLGNNLNQMMRHLHWTGEPAPADLEPLLTDIRGIIARGVKK